MKIISKLRTVWDWLDELVRHVTNDPEPEWPDKRVRIREMWDDKKASYVFVLQKMHPVPNGPKLYPLWIVVATGDAEKAKRWAEHYDISLPNVELTRGADNQHQQNKI